MKCISLWQPWATLWVVGAKVHETRDWPTNVRGTVAVHAAKRKHGDEREFCDELLAGRYGPSIALVYDDLPFGCIVGTVDLVDCVPTADVYRRTALDKVNDGPIPQDYWLGNYTVGRFAWRAENPVRFAEPVPYRGMQSFFEVPDELVASIMGVLDQGEEPTESDMRRMDQINTELENFIKSVKGSYDSH